MGPHVRRAEVVVVTLRQLEKHVCGVHVLSAKGIHAPNAALTRARVVDLYALNLKDDVGYAVEARRFEDFGYRRCMCGYHGNDSVACFFLLAI